MSILFADAGVEYDAATLAAAVRAVANHCDGAHDRDNVGFDGQDTHFGKRLAVIPHDVWSPDMVADAYAMMRKYRRQLAEYGIDFDSIPAPPEADTDKHASRDRARQLSGRMNVNIEVLADGIIVQGKYDAERVALFRQIPGRRWTGKYDTFPLSSARAVVRALDSLGAPVTDELRIVASELEARGEPEVQEGLKRAWVEGERLIVTFPYDRAMVDAIRNAPGAQWHKLPQHWSLDLSAESVEFCNAAGIELAEDAIELAINIHAERSRVVEMSKAVDADLDIEGLAPDSLYPFQRAGVAYALEKRRTWIADEMGLGKTRQALATLQASDCWPALIVVPASVKENWLREAKAVLPGRRGEVVYGGAARRFTGADFYIINYELLTKHEDRLRAAGFKGLVFDESHAYLSNPKLKRTKFAIELGRQAHDGIVLLLTGTPISNYPEGLIPQLEVMSRIEDFGGKGRFFYRYVREATTFGFNAERMKELHEKLRATCYVRREKAQVLTELPPKSRQVIEVELEPERLSEYRRAEADIVNYIRQRAEEYALKHGLDPTREGIAAAARAEAAQHLVAVTTLKRLAAKARMSYVHEWIREFQESTGRKLLVFGWHTDVVDEVAREYGGLRISGSDPVPRRQAVVDRFQNDPDAKVCALQIKAGGVGITLTAASDVLFIEQGWTPATHLQAEDRVHRIGQENHVTAHYHLAVGTIDERIYRLVEAKRMLSRAIEDGEVPEDYETDDTGSESILADLVADLVSNP